MPLTLEAEIVTAKNALHSSIPFFDLLEIYQASGEVPIRLVNNNQNVVWNFHKYTKFRFEKGDEEENTDSSQNSISIRVSNVTGYMQGVLEADANGMIGNVVIYRCIHPTSSTAAVEEWFSILNAVADDEWVTFTLGAENWFMNRFPGNVYSRDTCRYRPSMTDICAYTNQSICDRRFSTCIWLGQSSVFGGQPGIPGGAFDV